MITRSLTRALAVLALALVLAMPVMAFLHVIVPHAHDHGSRLHADLWHGLQTSLSRKDFIVVLLPVLAGFFALSVPKSLGAFFREFARPRKHAALQALRRGILAYRAFR